MSGQEEFLQALASAAPGTYVVGADEVGYGSWAGPLMVCAVAVPNGWMLPGLNDSKKLNERKREELLYALQRVPHHIARAEVEDINVEGLGTCLKRCFEEALSAVQKKVSGPSLIVFDGEVVLPDVEHFKFPRADGQVPAVMAASVLAKVTRDREMAKLANQYPGYGLGDHKGYGTPDHERRLKEKGAPSPVHRNYTPMERILTGKRGAKPRGTVEFGDDVDLC